MKFKFDLRDIPDNLSESSERTKFETAVLNRMNSSSAGAYKKDDPAFAAVVGMLVLDGYSDPKSADFESQFWTVRGEAAGTTVGATGAGPAATASAVSSTITLGAGSGGGIVITTNPPVSALNGEVFDPAAQPTVQVSSGSGPAVGVDVTASLASGGGTLDGTTTAPGCGAM